MQKTKNAIDVTHYPIINKAENIESILCLAVLTANHTLPNNASIEDSNSYYESLGRFGCSECHFQHECLACRINE